MEKARLGVQPFQLIARQRREACQLSGSGGRDNERDLLTMVMPSPPAGRSKLHPLADKECHRGTSSFKKRERHELQNVSCCMQGPGETGETWTYPSMVLVPLCTAMVMAWSLQGELRFLLATFHYHSLPPASKERKLRLSFLQAHCNVVTGAERMV